MDACASCGIAIPSGQSWCSRCYGDPDYGQDGYLAADIAAEQEYNDRLEEIRREMKAEAREAERQRREDEAREEAMIEAAEYDDED
jgi:hypothetical protein